MWTKLFFFNFFWSGVRKGPSETLSSNRILGINYGIILRLMKGFGLENPNFDLLWVKVRAARQSRLFLKVGQVGRACLARSSASRSPPQRLSLHNRKFYSPSALDVRFLLIINLWPSYEKVIS